MADEKDRLLSSDYDGIREYDNALPKWWLWLFYVTIAWGVVYAGWIHFGFAPTADARLQGRLAELQATKELARRAAAAGELDGSALLRLVKDPQAVDAGKGIYQSSCMPCHGMHGEGLVGPNLTDDYWIHGGTTSDLRKTIRDGILDKGMVAWAGILSPKEIDSVVAYVWTLHGTNPANAKAAQGDLMDLASRERASAAHE